MAGVKTDQAVRAGLNAPQRDWVFGPVMAGVMAIVLGCWAQGGDAQTLKKYVTPDGKTIYSDTPVPGAKVVGEVIAPPPPDPAVIEAARQRESAAGAGANRQADKLLKEREMERLRSEDASAKLKIARDALELGRTPKPGDRIGTASGGSRFSEEYLARQRTNEDAVKRAEEDLNKARRP